MKFTKIHGLGNDYIYINAIKYQINNPSKLSKILSERHLGIGADGIILLLKPTKPNADFKMRIFNSDGSEAEMCGNGIRGLAKYIYENNFSKKSILNIETNAGIKELTLDIKNNKVINTTVDMGEVTLDTNIIPVNINSKNCLNKRVLVDNDEYYLNCISVGNPHCVIYTDNIEKVDLQKLGPIFENHELFPNKTNVEFIEIIDRNNIIMKVWERGSGETLACGTGACASAVISYLSGKTDNKCTIHVKEGILNIYFNEQTRHVFLSGTATKVFDGNIKIKNLRR